jgi:uncharacterized protein (DUF169 family)
MKSHIAELLDLQYPPVAVHWANAKPEGALQFKQGKWGCVMFLLCNAAKGKPAAADRATFGCIGGGVGLGFGNMYTQFPGGIAEYLSTGNPEFCRTEFGKQVAQAMPELEEGERYCKDPDTAQNFIDGLPMVDVPEQYAVFRPLDMVEDGERPATIVFLANADQVSALVVLANYGRRDRETVVAPFAAGCHQIGILPLDESKKENPRAILGLTDISARKNTMGMIGHDFLTFAVPFKMFEEMEALTAGSFLERGQWGKVREHAHKSRGGA